MAREIITQFVASNCFTTSALITILRDRLKRPLLSPGSLPRELSDVKLKELAC